VCLDEENLVRDFFSYRAKPCRCWSENSESALTDALAHHYGILLTAVSECGRERQPTTSLTYAPSGPVNCSRRELPVTEQVSGVLADLFRAELIGWTVEIAREILDDSQVGARGTFGVVATRDFIERHFSKLGHRDLLVTPKYRYRIPNARHTAHAKRLP
jgi:hypothetical protein